ncbi:MAG: ABC transporter permease subunit [Firmicutes bacterium]|nr:ABC transporter permease subunit [Bacillota bacterium]
MTESNLRNKRTLSVILWILALLVVWEVVSLLMSNVFHDPMAEKKLPDLLTIAGSFRDYWQIILRQAGVTFSFAFSGFVIGTAAGFILAIIMRLSGIIEKMAMPYLLASQMIPILGLAPIVLGLLKDINGARIAIAAYITFFPISMSLLGGLKSVPKSYLDLMHSYAAGNVALFTKLLLPWALPNLFSGLKIAAPVAIAAAILVDTLSARDGIGYVIIYTLYGGGTVGQFWLAIIVAALMGVLSFALISLGEQLFLKKRRKEGKKR